MKDIQRQYFGPAVAVAVLPTPEQEQDFKPNPEQSVDLDFLSGFSESEIHTYIRLKHILARLPMPAIPVEQMERFEEMLEALFSILADGKVSLDDWQDMLTLVRGVARLVAKKPA
jgi:hypothetical protein